MTKILRNLFPYSTILECCAQVHLYNLLFSARTGFIAICYFGFYCFYQDRHFNGKRLLNNDDEAIIFNQKITRAAQGCAAILRRRSTADRTRFSDENLCIEQLTCGVLENSHCVCVAGFSYVSNTSTHA